MFFDSTVSYYSIIIFIQDFDVLKFCLKPDGPIFDAFGVILRFLTCIIYFFAAIASSSYERVCLLFNIAALQSQVGQSQNLTSDDGLKTAAKLFQVILCLHKTTT